MRGRSMLVLSSVISLIAVVGFRIRSFIAIPAPAIARLAAVEPGESRGAGATAVRVVAVGAKATLEIEPGNVEGASDLGADKAQPESIDPPDSVLLHVLDAETKVELEDVMVLPIVDRFCQTVPHPGSVDARNAIVDRAKSPVRLLSRFEGKDVGTDEFWVGAPGHSWEATTIRFWDTDEYSVELQPDATLVVDFCGTLPEPRNEDEAPRLRLRRLSSRSDEPGDLIAELIAKPGETRIEGLAAGDLVVALEVGWSRQRPRVVGRVSTTLHEHQTQFVTLTIPTIELPRSAPFAGTLFIPDAWQNHDVSLWLEPLDLLGDARTDHVTIALEKMKPIRERPGWYRWKAGQLHPATYRCEITSTGFTREIEVSPSGDENVELVVTEPATMIVHVVDAASGEPLAIHGLDWCPDHDTEQLRSSVPFRLDEVGLRYEAVVPTGRGTFETIDDAWILVDESAHSEAHTGTQEFIVRAHRACGLILQLTREGEPVQPPADLRFDTRLVAIGHDGVAARRSYTIPAGISTISATKSGRYLVTIPRIPGDEPIEPFEVDLPSGSFITRVVELRRAR